MYSLSNSINKMTLFIHTSYNLISSPSASYKRKTADDITDYLRDDDWEFGLCDDDLVILVSDQDRFVRQPVLFPQIFFVYLQLYQYSDTKIQ